MARLMDDVGRIRDTDSRDQGAAPGCYAPYRQCVSFLPDHPAPSR